MKRRWVTSPVSVPGLTPAHRLVSQAERWNRKKRNAAAVLSCPRVHSVLLGTRAEDARAGRPAAWQQAEDDHLIFRRAARTRRGSGAPEIAVPFAPAILKNVRLRFFIVYNLTPRDRARAVADLTRLLEEQALTHNIGARLPLERAAEAHELVEQGRATGNVVLQVG